MRRVLCLLLCVALLCPSAAVFGAEEEMSVYINGSPAKLDTQPEMQDDVLMLPIRELMERLGFYVGTGEYNRRSVTKTGYIAKINSAEMIVPPDSPEACYDEVWFELDAPTRAVEKDVLVPATYIDNFYGIDIAVQEDTVRITARDSGQVRVEDLQGDVLQEMLSTMPAGDTIIGEEEFINSEVRGGEDNGIFTKEILDMDDDAMTYGRAVELETLIKPNNTYDAQLQIPTVGDVEKGDLLILSFWAKMIISTDESGLATVGCTFEEYARKTYLAALDDETVTLSEKWQRFDIPFAGIDNWSAGVARLCLKVGYKPQTIQIAGLKVVNYHKAANIADVQKSKISTETYYGRDEDAIWRKEALKRIEKYRVRDINVSVADESGAPVPGAEVKAEMTRSEFMWGSIGPADEANMTGVNMTENMKKYFNAITPESAMKMAGYQTWKGSRAVDVTNFALDNNMYLHGHAVFWDKYTANGWIGDRAATMSREFLENYIYSHASEMISYFGDAMKQLDVLNEPNANSKLRDRFGVEFVSNLYRISKLLRDDYAPDLKLYLNETGIWGNDGSWSNVYKLDALLKQMMADGAEIDGLGIQAHTRPIYYPQTLYNQIDYFADLMDEITVTEFDAAYNGPTMATDRMQELEGDFFRDSLIMAYSNPKIVGFIMWGFYDSRHWRADSPMLNRQFNEKPGVKNWHDLVLGEWKTNTGGVTDEAGNCAMRGHRGEYDIKVSCGGQTAKTTLMVTDTGENSVKAIVRTDGTIELTPSEAVVPLQVARKNARELDANRIQLQNNYKKYLENCITRAVINDGREADILLDGSAESFWASNGVDSFVVCETEEVCHGGTLHITWRPDGRKNLYAVEASVDGETWQEVRSGIGEGTEDIPLLHTDVKYLRIKSLTNRSISLSEVSFSKY